MNKTKSAFGEFPENLVIVPKYGGGLPLYVLRGEKKDRTPIFRECGPCYCAARHIGDVT